MQSMQYSPATQAINLAQLMVQYMKPMKVEMETVSSLVKGAMCFQLTRIQLGLSAPLHNVLSVAFAPWNSFIFFGSTCVMRRTDMLHTCSAPYQIEEWSLDRKKDERPLCEQCK